MLSWGGHCEKEEPDGRELLQAGSTTVQRITCWEAGESSQHGSQWGEVRTTPSWYGHGRQCK